MFKLSLKLIDSNNDVNRLFRRSVGHKRFQKFKKMKDHSFTPWKSAEVVESIEETLNTPYQQLSPTNPVKRISESNPANHTYQDVGKFYTIPVDDRTHYFQLAGIPKSFSYLTQIFNETCLMVRKPAIETIEYMKKANYDKLPVKYVIHGDSGCGKRLTRLHILHYAFLNDFIVFDIPAVSQFFKYGRKEANISEKRPPLVDIPLEGAVILKNFQLQNGEKIEDLKLKTSKDYVWNSRETTPAGTPLMTLVNHGINRVKYSCDCIDGLVDELKRAATEKEIKLLVSIDQFNSFLAGKTMLQIDNKYNIDTRRTAIYNSILRFLQLDWSNGAILTTVDEKSTLPEFRGSSFPFFLLRREGFELFDPFVPVEVPKYSEMEFHSMLDYYEDRRWLQKLGKRDELDFLTARVPRELRKFVSAL